MTRFALAVFAALVLPTATASAADTWMSDLSRSQLTFTSAYGSDPVKGVFKKWSAQIAFDPNDLPHSHLDVTVDTASVDTGVEEQDAALIGAEWFATKMFPQARFVASTIRPGKTHDTFEAAGELTLRGVSKPVTVSFVASREGSELAMKGTATLDRSSFGVGTGQWSREDSVPFRVEVHFDLKARRTGPGVSGSAPLTSTERPASSGLANSSALPAGAPGVASAASATVRSTTAQAAALSGASATAPPATAQAAGSGASATAPAADASAAAAPASADASWRNAAANDYTPTPAFPNQTRAPAPAVPSKFQVQVLTSGLVQPWSLAFLPDGRMLVTERPGRLRIITRDGVQSPPIEGLPTIKTIAAEGLHDVVLDPGFARNRTLYFTYFAPLPNDTPPTLEAWIDWLKLPAGEHEEHPFGYERVARARLSADERRLEDVKVILEGGDRRLVFARDGSLLVAASPPAGGGIPVDEEPQRLGNTYGKVLRIKPDGSIPKDNPFIGRAGVRPEIFAYGLRDVEGATLDPRTGDLWTLEHGPRGGDELNHVRAGKNYGFPLISYGREYSGDLINGGKTAQDGLEQPVYFWTPSIAPSGLLFYTGNLFPAWKGSVFVGAMAGKRLIRLGLDGNRVKTEEALLVERGKRIRDIRQGPDGAVYVLTAEPQGELLRLSPPH
jgi:glucose/arabinose dehydrogenase/polyisoprenoid-binding protein YceI